MNSNERQGVSRAAYKALLKNGFNPGNRAFSRKDKFVIMESLQEEYNNCQMELYKSSRFLMGLCTYPTAKGMVLIPAWWQSNCKYLNLKDVEGYLQEFQIQKEAYEKSGRTADFQNWIKAGWLPDIEIEALHLLSDNGFNQTNYYKDALVLKHALKDFGSQEIKVYSTIGGLKLWYTQWADNKQPRAWLLEHKLNANVIKNIMEVYKEL